MTQAAPGTTPAPLSSPGPQGGLSARELRRLDAFKSRLLRRPGLGPVLADAARRNALPSLVWLVLGAVAVWQARPAWAVLPLAMLAVPFALAAWTYRGNRQRAELLEAFALGDWPRVDGLASQLRASPGLSPAMAFDLDVRVIIGQVVRGRPLAEALSMLSRWAPKLAEAQPGLFDMQVATVHAAAGDRPGFVQRLRTASEASGREPSQVLELALAEARFGDPLAARALLDGPEMAQVPARTMAFVHWARGALALRSSQPQATDELSRGVAGLLEAARTQPALWPALAFCTADLAMALRATGQTEPARQILARVLPVLRAHADKPLMHVLEQDILFAPNSPTRT
jgi:hypothetical protein